MTHRTLKLTAAVSVSALLLAGMLSCSTSSESPDDPVNPGSGGPAELRPPVIVAVSPSQSCATAGNRVSISGSNLVDNDFLASVTINGIAATVTERFDGSPTGSLDVLTVTTPAFTVPSGGALVDVRVITENGADTAVGAIRFVPACDGPPLLVDINPATGGRAGFDFVELIGDNLACLTGVQFVSTATTTTLVAEIVQVNSDQSVFILTPATNDPSSAPYQVIVTSQCGSNAAPRPTFTYQGTGTGDGPILPNALTITDVTTGLPQGPAAGGNRVRITGTDLALVTSIRIGALTLGPSQFFVNALGEIVIPAMPQSPAGLGATEPFAVVVVSADGQDATPLTYTYIGAGQPNCVSINPASGPLEGGTQVTINGINLNQVDEVTFGGVKVDTVFYPTADGSKLVVLSPEFPAATDVDIALLVVNGSVSSVIDTCAPARFTYVDVTGGDPPFSLTGISPNGGPQTGGTTIVLTGTGLDLVTSVTICGVSATITSAVSEQVQATTGLFNGTVPALCDVVVSTSDGQSAVLVGDDRFEYRPVVPDAQVFATNSARTAPQAGGTSFRLQGVNLIGVTEIRFGGTQSPNAALACDLDVQSNTEVSGTAPAFVTPGASFPASVSVVAASAAGVDSTPLTFVYHANPTIAFARGPLNDNRIQVNERVVVFGNNFRPSLDDFVAEIAISNTGVTGNGAPGAATETLTRGEFVIVSNGRLEFDFPSSLVIEDFYDVTIRTPGAGSSCVNAYEDTAARTLFLGTRPAADRVQPSFGRWDGGTTVVIEGNFQTPVQSVTICGVAHSPIAGSQTATEVRIRTRSTGSEAAAGTPCDVIVINTAGNSDPIPGGFTFTRSPNIMAVEVDTPNCGPRSSTAGIVPVTAGQILTINGFDFGFNPAGVNRVLIGTAEATIRQATRTDTLLEVFVPAEPAGGPRHDVKVEVIFPAAPGATADTPFSDVLPLVVDYQNVPAITSITPTSTAPGNTVTIAGTNLRDVDGTPPTVQFNGVPAVVQSATETSVVVVVPTPLPNTLGVPVPVTLTTCQGQSATSFTYPCPIPRITSFTPAQGAPPGVVIINGTDLIVSGQTPVVEFGGVGAVVDMGLSTPTQVHVDIPAGSAGSRVSITVETCGGTATSGTQFVYTCSAPAITNVMPGFGVAGTTVTLSGAFDNAGNPPTVRFGLTPVASITSFSASQIVVPAPPGTGTVDVIVQTCGGTATQVGGFTYCVVPNATSVTPTTGAAGAIVVISGTNLQDPDGGPPVVTFGAANVPAVVVASSPTTIQVQAPAGVSGVATVNVTTCGGTDSAGTFQYCVTPTITSFTPTVGRDGTQVTIIGTDLRGANGVDAVIRFGGVTVATVVSSSPTQFIVLAPAGPTGQVVVDATTCGGTGQAATLFSYCVLPVVTGIVPTNGAAGDEVTIFGTDLIGANGVPGTVRFGNTTATIVTVDPSGTEMIVLAPAGFSQGQSVNVRVDTCGGTSATHAGTVFTYQTSTTCVAPTVSGITPEAAAVGQQLTVQGANLIGNDGIPGTVTVGGVPATLIASTPTQLVVTVPAGTGTVGVSVTTCGGTAQSPELFTYCQVPVLNTVTPSSGPAGSNVILSGTSLLGADGASPVVTFGTFTATIIDQTATQLTVTAPTGPAAGTTVNVRVTTCGGASNPQSFQYVSTTQFDVTSVTPTAGPNTGGQVISISGTGLNGTGGSAILGIQICDVVVTSFTPISDTLVQATTAPFTGAVPATCDLEVILVDGRQDTLVGGYTYLPPVPDGRVFDEIGDFTINAPQVGGTTIRILGVNLIGVTAVNFGGFAGDPKACNVQVASDTQVTAIVPAYATPLGSPQSVEVFVESAAGVDPTTVEVDPSGSGILYRYHPNPTMTSASQGAFPGTNPPIVTITGASFRVGDDVFLHPFIQVKNLGFTDPTNSPAGTVFDLEVPILTITDTTFTFRMPSVTLGDFYSVTITTPNQGASCVDQYSFTLAPAVFVAAEGNCFNLGDDDGDGLIDCDDPDCAGDVSCP